MHLHAPNQTQANPARGVPIGMLLLALLLCAACFAYVLVRWPDNFFADDSYFYLEVAWNFAHGRGSTFNGLMPTNGYHPLWMLVCASVYTCVTSKLAAVHVIGSVIATLNLITLAGVTVLLRRAGVGTAAVAWVILLPFLFTSQLGTEGALNAACLTLTLLAAFRFVQSPDRRTAFAWALGGALAVLSRLDNIFVVLALMTALLLDGRRARDARTARMLLETAPIPIALWGVYLWTNRHFFGIWQPISGLLKAHGDRVHRLGSNLPHIAWFDLLVIGIGLPVLWRLRRDLFLRSVELPLAFGVGVHALYIVFVMSNETRWSWYYTTWTLLASVVAARTISAVLHGDQRLQWPVLGTCCTVLLILAIRNAHLRGHDNRSAHELELQRDAIDRAHLTTLLAFDKPGRIAYYSTARIIPLDGLMGDLRFQQELGTVGLATLSRRHGVDGFIGPPQPLNAAGKRDFCDALFLSATRFECEARQDGTYQVTGAQVFARLSGRPAGAVRLPPSQIIWNAPGYVAVWRLEPRP